MVHKGHAFVGHMFSDGFTITDVRDPRHPRPVNFIAAPPNTRAFHLQTHGDLLLTVNSPNIWVLQGYTDPNDYFKGSITETGKIVPSRVSGTKARYQRQLGVAIKRARFLALLPYSDGQ